MRVAIGSASFGKADAAPLERLAAAGVEVVPNPHGRALTEAEALELVRDVEGWLAGSEPVSRAVMSQAKRLRAVARIGTGLDSVDVDAAAELGIAVSRTRDAATQAVAEMTLAALLALNRHVVPAANDLRAGRWVRHLGRDLAAQTVLIIGHGRIGARVAQLVRAFGARVLVVDPAVDGSLTLEEGLRQADVISIHADARAPILDARALSHVRPGATLLNAARGALIDEAALITALDEGRIGACWLDVFAEEPYAGPLLAYPQVLATPHAATFTRECRLQMELDAVENLLRDLGRG